MHSQETNTMRFNSFSTRFTSANQSPLTLEQIAHYAPSALAVMPHESRSARYTYIPTVDIIKGMHDAGFLPFKATQSTTRDESRREFTKHMIRFRQSAQALKVGDIFQEIVLVNSHDGTSAYKLFAGIFRLVCGNGMTVSESTLGSITVMHKGNVVEDVVNGSLQIAGQSDRVLDTVNQWRNLQLTSGEQSAFANAAHTLRFADSEGEVSTPIQPAQLLHIRRSDDSGSDMWRTFNRVQENVMRGGLAARQPASTDQYGRYVRGRKVSTREVKGIDQDVKLNRALWQLAEEMAKLKAA
jgi:hypothetical protein